MLEAANYGTVVYKGRLMSIEYTAASCEYPSRSMANHHDELLCIYLSNIHTPLHDIYMIYIYVDNVRRLTPLSVGGGSKTCLCGIPDV